MTIVEYLFPDRPSDTDYCVFPAYLENDDLVLFHATPAENLDGISKQGFKIPDPSGKCGLPSVSFAKRSVSALTHAMGMRKVRPGEYCIIAVRYSTLERSGLAINHGDIHDYTLNPPPQIIGYCRVPMSYVHA